MFNKLEELLNENKELYEKIDNLKQEVRVLKDTTSHLNRERTGLLDQISTMKRELCGMKKDILAKEKVMNEREKTFKNEINRRDVFKNKLLGCKKDEKMNILKTQFNIISKKNIILLRMLHELTRLLGGDFELFSLLLEITDEQDCSILEEYLENLKQLKMDKQQL
ncbi:hypothetical protein NGRA_1405 [Nosema granulosis]|uniref:Uncharacterized protein n=1 Tax=Nosema granulosis TaxID=83296 RepID=A0A9P6H1T6_9MICR|nr:hypothetical protein NGRA_1405 [Nosema granulosis]